jgi:hypothetical protein
MEDVAGYLLRVFLFFIFLSSDEARRYSTVRNVSYVSMDYTQAMRDHIVDIIFPRGN